MNYSVHILKLWLAVFFSFLKTNSIIRAKANNWTLLQIFWTFQIEPEGCASVWEKVLEFDALGMNPGLYLLQIATESQIALNGDKTKPEMQQISHNEIVGNHSLYIEKTQWHNSSSFVWQCAALTEFGLLASCVGWTDAFLAQPVLMFGQSFQSSAEAAVAWTVLTAIQDLLYWLFSVQCTGCQRSSLWLWTVDWGNGWKGLLSPLEY